ncbi:MAG: hypothetical protein DIU61_006240 [Bacteroidota bacterium]|jgi:hypothetical protein|nr:MAG: hypothetical protein DIU61_16775 [Bacteroidota bacterium]
MSFEEYLVGKKIDPALFRAGDPELWSSWERDFAQQHPASFTAQKLYLINAVRRKYHLKASEAPMTPADTGQAAAKPAAKPAARPIVRPKPKM